MHFIYEQDLRRNISELGKWVKGTLNPRDDFSFAFFPPLRHLCVYLISELGLYLTSITGEQSEETLRPTINDIYFV